MEKEELTNELLDFLDETSNYYNFLEWEKERGYEIDEVKSVIEESREI